MGRDPRLFYETRRLQASLSIGVADELTSDTLTCHNTVGARWFLDSRIFVTFATMNTLVFRNVYPVLRIRFLGERWRPRRSVGCELTFASFSS